MKQLNEMAKSRSLWIDQLVDNMTGAYVEYCFVYLEKLNNTNKHIDQKTREYKKLIKFNVLRVYHARTKQPFDKNIALNEAFKEVEDFHKVGTEKYAKSEYDDYYEIKSKIKISEDCWIGFKKEVTESINSLDENVNVWGIPINAD